MKTKVSSAIALCGTEQADAPGRILKAGPMQVEFDNGQLRYLKVNGVEVLRAIGFLVRDENWGTYAPKISGLRIDQRADGFSVAFHAVCSRKGQEIAYDARIEGTKEGNLVFDGTAVPKTDFLTARTGFVVLHPLTGVAGHAVEVEHVDGKIVKDKFPEQVNPVQPFLNIRALTHEVSPGLKATVRMEGDTFEMEDHRNWTDASFKTYVRPLILPWPYTLKAGEKVSQSIKVTLSGGAKGRTNAGAQGAVEVRLGAATWKSLPPIGLGMPAEEIAHSVARLDLLRRAAPKFLICHFDPRQKHGLRELYGYRVLCEQGGADCVLEAVVESVDGYRQELQRLAGLVRDSGLKLSAIAVCPVGDLKSVLPGGPRPPAPALEELYAAARAAFPGVALGGGMFSFFTELNRKRPPAKLLDFVHNTTCPIVHAADDRSVMETLEALPYQVKTARSFIGKTAYRIGPTAIGCRDNPHGATWTAGLPDQAGAAPARAVRRGVDARLHRHLRPHRRAVGRAGRADRAARHRLAQGRSPATGLRRAGRHAGVPGVPCGQRARAQRRAETGCGGFLRRRQDPGPCLQGEAGHHAVARQSQRGTAGGEDQRRRRRHRRHGAGRSQLCAGDDRPGRLPVALETDEVNAETGALRGRGAVDRRLNYSPTRRRPAPPCPCRAITSSSPSVFRCRAVPPASTGPAATRPASASRRCPSQTT
jgi:D-apionolactonase